MPGLLRDPYRLAEMAERLGEPPDGPERPGQRIPYWREQGEAELVALG